MTNFIRQVSIAVWNKLGISLVWKMEWRCVMRLHLNGFDDDGSDRLVCLSVVVAVLALTAAAVLYLGLVYQAPATTAARVLLSAPL